MSALTIDVISDIVCPWCFIGTRRLDLALASLPQPIEATVVYRPFLLDPSTPPDGEDLRERLGRKLGMDPEPMFERVEAAARESGIPLDFSKVRRSVSTARAHVLLRHALEKGTQRALAGALFEAYFLDGLDVGRVDVLAAIGARHGFAVDEVEATLLDPAELALTLDEARAVAAQGVQGVPYFVFRRRFAVSGAQTPEVFRAAIARALAPEGARAAPGVRPRSV
jgi:predicted DsbA family dithiol-disulfide isomerase